MTKDVQIDAETAKKIVSESPAIIYICKAYGDFAATYVTPNISNAVGYSAEEFLSYPGFWADRIHPDDKEQTFNDLNLLFENGHHIHKYRFQHKDGSYRWMHDELTLLKDESGEPNEILGYWIDITELINTTEELKNTTSQLEATLNATSNGIIVFNRDNFITSFNKKFLEMWQIPKDVISTFDSKSLLTNYILPLLKEPEKLTQIITVLANHPDAEITDRVEFKNGNIFEFYSQAQWVDNKAIGRVWSFRDITESELYKQSLLDAKEQAEHISRAKTNFLRSMSHELRTPMNAIMGFTQLLISDPEDPLSKEQHSSMQEIMGASNLLLKLINEILDLSQIESGKLNISIQETSIKENIQQCIKLISPLANTQQVQIIDNISSNEDSLVLVDPQRLIQVILNLISNAVKYNQVGGSVNIKTEKLSPDWLRLSIEDTGYGIGEDELSIIFEPFERLRYKSSTIEGAGIGLNVAKQLIEAMQGEIGVESVIDKGSVFWIELPLVKAD